MNIPNNSIDCLGVVLAGGLSSRMGKDKATLMRNNVDMLTFSKQLLKDAGISQVIVSGGQHLQNNAGNNLSKNLGTNVSNHTSSNTYTITDSVHQAGPVGGIFSVLQQHAPKSLLILPVDLPLMTAAALKKLILTGQLSNKACFYQDHQIPLYLPNNAYLELFLKQAFSQYQHTTEFSTQKRGPSMKALLQQVPHTILPVASTNTKDAQILFNTNTPEQWQQAKHHFC